MGTYRSTIHVECRKEHTCVGCGGAYSYPLRRSVSKDGRNPEVAAGRAREAAERVLSDHVESYPCPSCGLVQPDMIGQWRARRHWHILAATAGAAVLVAGYYYLVGESQAELVYAAVAVGAANVAANLATDLRRHNRNPTARRTWARTLVANGRMWERIPGTTDTPPARWRSPAWAAGHWVVYLGLVGVLGAFAAPEVVRLSQGWPLNPGWRPQVVGPGDESVRKVAGPVRSVKGLWTGTAEVQATAVGGSGKWSLHLPATASKKEWGDVIGSKQAILTEPADLWVAVRIPDDVALEYRTYQLTGKLHVSYPAETANPLGGGRVFENAKTTVDWDGELRLGALKAGEQYTHLWWFSQVGGLGLLVVLNLGLVLAAHALKGRAPKSSVWGFVN